MPRKPAAPNPRPKRVDPWLARPSPLLVSLAAHFHLTQWVEEYGGECFTVTASDRVGSKPTVSIDGLHRDHSKDDAANTARVVSILRELADLIEQCEAEAGPAPEAPDVGSAAEYGTRGEAGALAQAAIAGAAAGLMQAVAGSALARFSSGNNEDAEDDDDQENEEQDDELRAFAEAKEAIADGSFVDLPDGCEWLALAHNEGRELILSDERSGPEAGHVGDGNVRREKDVWRWEMTGTASRGMVPTLTEGARVLAEFACGSRKVEPLEPTPATEKPKRKGRPPGSKNRPKIAAGQTEIGMPPEPPPEPADPPAPPPDPSTETPAAIFVLERFSDAGGSLDPRVVPPEEAEGLGEATAKGWLRPLPPVGGVVVLLRITDAGWDALAEHERREAAP